MIFSSEHPCWILVPHMARKIAGVFCFVYSDEVLLEITGILILLMNQIPSL